MNQTIPVQAPPAAPSRTRLADAADIREFLTFELDGQTCGFDLRHVQEVRSFEPPTRLLQAEPWVLGVIDLRGTIVPIADLRRRLGVAPGFDARTVTVVVNVGSQTVGMVVDAVSDVVAVETDRLKAPPEGRALETGCVCGLASIGSETGESRLLIALDTRELIRGMTRENAAASH